MDALLPQEIQRGDMDSVGALQLINCQQNCQYASFIAMVISSSEVGRGRKDFFEQWMGRSPPFGTHEVLQRRLNCD
jgi:hypothetical protein